MGAGCAELSSCSPRTTALVREKHRAPLWGGVLGFLRLDQMAVGVREGDHHGRRCQMQGFLPGQDRGQSQVWSTSSLSFPTLAGASDVRSHLFS